MPGGELYLNDSLVEDCTAVASSADPPATGGAFAINNNISGNASLLVLRRSTIRRCRAVQLLANGTALGGGIFVLAGSVTMEQTSIIQCTAGCGSAGCTDPAGGGLFVTGRQSSVMMSQASKLVDNEAILGKALWVASGAVTYLLPAPPGHWICFPS